MSKTLDVSKVSVIHGRVYLSNDWLLSPWSKETVINGCLGRNMAMVVNGCLGSVCLIRGASVDIVEKSRY